MPKSRRFEFIDATSNKFWEVSVASAMVTVHYGRIGTDGQTKVRAYDSTAEAKAAAEKQIAEKIRKGYTEVRGATAGKTPAPAKAAVTRKTAKKAAAPAPKVAPKTVLKRTAAGTMLIGQRRFGGIVFFEDRTHYYVASLKEDERLDSRDNVHEAAGRRYGPKQPEYFEIGGFRDWYLPTILELELMDTYINSKALGDFEDDWYWSNDDYEDEDGEVGDAVPFKFGPPRAEVALSMVDYKKDLAHLERIARGRNYPTYTGGGEYSGARELYVRLIRKQPRK